MQQESSLHFSIRPAHLPGDYPDLAALLTALHPDWPITAEELAAEDADLASDPDRLIKLYELDKALWHNVPYGDTVEDRTLEQFEREETLALKYIHEACFIAIHGTTFIGYSNLTRGDGYFMTDMTGVLPAYRGKGAATLLKLYDIRYAQAHGNYELRVTNDSVNTAMLGLNEKLGFKRGGATIRLVKQMILD